MGYTIPIRGIGVGIAIHIRVYFDRMDVYYGSWPAPTSTSKKIDREARRVETLGIREPTAVTFQNSIWPGTTANTALINSTASTPSALATATNSTKSRRRSRLPRSVDF